MYVDRYIKNNKDKIKKLTKKKNIMVVRRAYFLWNEYSQAIN